LLYLHKKIGFWKIIFPAGTLFFHRSAGCPGDHPTLPSRHASFRQAGRFSGGKPFSCQRNRFYRLSTGCTGVSWFYWQKSGFTDGFSGGMPETAAGPFIRRNNGYFWAYTFSWGAFISKAYGFC
jgi:hypothetical protein